MEGNLDLVKKKLYPEGTVQISQNEIIQLINRSGTRNEFSKLNDRQITSLINGLNYLNEIDKIGLNIENSDKEVLGRIDEMKMVVEENLSQLKWSFHGTNLDWLGNSVRFLIKNTTEKNPKIRGENINAGMTPAGNYIRMLRTTGENYRNKISNINKAEDIQEVSKYLNSLRDPKVGEMQGLLNRRVAEAFQTPALVETK